MEIDTNFITREYMVKLLILVTIKMEKKKKLRIYHPYNIHKSL